MGSDSIVEPPPLLDEDDGLGECVENGPEFTAKLVRQWLARLGVQTLYIEPGSRLEPSILAVEPAVNPPCWASKTVVGLNLTIPRNCLSALAGERLATISHSMYRLERTGLAWILDAPDPSSSFPSLKQHEMKQFGEYRTQRYALRAFDQLGKV